MKVYEFGQDNERNFVMFQCALEPWWAFEASAKRMAEDHHVYLFITDGQDETETEFESIEKNVDQVSSYLREHGVNHVDCMYGVSMGGSSVIRFLATEDIPVDKAIIDAGITPYPYSRFVCKLISCWDWLTMMLGTKNMTIMKLAAPPERWAPKDEDPEAHYIRIFNFEKKLTSRTVYNIFWSANNYSMPDPVPHVDTKIEYWYGEEEKKARKDNLAYTKKAYPQTVEKEFKGLAHAELVLMFPERFAAEVRRFLSA